MEKVDLTVDSASTCTNDGAWQNLDALLCCIAAIGEHLSTNEFVKADEETPVFKNGKIQRIYPSSENLVTIKTSKILELYKTNLEQSPSPLEWLDNCILLACIRELSAASIRRGFKIKTSWHLCWWKR